MASAGALDRTALPEIYGGQGGRLAGNAIPRVGKVRSIVVSHSEVIGVHVKVSRIVYRAGHDIVGKNHPVVLVEIELLRAVSKLVPVPEVST